MTLERLQGHAVGLYGALIALQGHWLIGSALMLFAAYALRVLRVIGR